MTEKKLIFYFHGYGSSAQSDKVERLKAAGGVFGLDIDPNPIVSMPKLREQISSVLEDYIDASDHEIVFVGTSLGAWYASQIGNVFGIDHVILINPAIDPSVILGQLGVSDEIRGRYYKMHIKPSYNIFIGLQDELIDFSEFDFENANVVYADAGHRFNGPEFDKVVEFIKKI